MIVDDGQAGDAKVFISSDRILIDGISPELSLPCSLSYMDYIYTKTLHELHMEWHGKAYNL